MARCVEVSHQLEQTVAIEIRQAGLDIAPAGCATHFARCNDSARPTFRRLGRMHSVENLSRQDRKRSALEVAIVHVSRDCSVVLAHAIQSARSGAETPAAAIAASRAGSCVASGKVRRSASSR